jgi:hypothetical protein
MSNNVFAIETQKAGALCMSGRAVEGYACYAKLVDNFVSTGKFTSTASIAGHPLSWLFANAMHALTSCIANEEIPDTAPLAAALDRAAAACETSKPKCFDGLVLAHFGLGMHAWLSRNSRNRELAADQYVMGVAAGRAAAAARVSLCEFAREKAGLCAENLAVLRGDAQLGPSPLNAGRAFIVTAPSSLAGQPELKKISKSLCGACAKDMAPLRCSRCLAVRYCDAACQRAQWAEHKKACKAPLNVGAMD